MARYIDADALLEKICDEECYLPATGIALLNIRDVIGIICNMPTADVAPVVRCKDCKHCRNLPHGMCYLNTEPYDNERGYKGEAVCVEADDFCSYGEKAR